MHKSYLLILGKSWKLKKVEEIHKIIKNPGKPKLRINMTTKKPSRQQIIVPMRTNNISKFIFSLEDYITNINRALKNIKSEILADFVHSNHWGLIITNKVTSQLNLSTIEKYIKNIDIIKTKDILTFYFP